MRMHEMNEEQYAATVLARQIERIAERLEREVVELREHAERMKNGTCRGYLSDVATIQNSIMWTVANCNLGQLTDNAVDAEKGRETVKATLAQVAK